MTRIFVALIAASFLMAGCSGVDVYTSKKERVDQEIKGNEGYLQGEAPDRSKEARSTERTIITVDIDLDGGREKAGTKERFRSGDPLPETPGKTSDVKQHASSSEKKSTKTQQNAPDTVIVETGEYGSEEVWIK